MLCPVNYYCKEGVFVGTACGAGTFNRDSGGVSDQECLPCEPGYECRTVGGVTVVTECPIGFWCPEYDTATNTQAAAQECPIYTSSAVTKIFMEEQCTYCPAGYDCADTGITEYTQFACEIGHFCIPNGLNGGTAGNGEYVSKHQCPDGFYGNRTGLTSYDSCTTCPKGKYCENSLSTITPQDCVGGEYCPEGSELPITCEGGFYCNTDTVFQEVICPVNNYCESGFTDPILCADGVICPEGSLRGTKCNIGYEVQLVNGADTCIACPEGYYNDDAAVLCKLCPAGYLCYGEPTTVPANSVGGTNRKNPTEKLVHYGEICPAGYYCPEGSYEATPCGVGYYNAFKGGKSEEDCIVCPENTYNDLTGQVGCQPCGEFAYSTSGSQTCTCYGDYRIFGKSDSSCRCLPRYVFRKKNGKIERNNVSKEDCIALTYERCSSVDEVRVIEGQCERLDGNYCETKCESKNGTLDRTGQCTCSDTSPTAEATCNQACIAASCDVTMDNEGTVTYTAEDGSTYTLDYSTYTGARGDLECASEQGCSLTQVNMDGGSIEGSYGCTAFNTDVAIRRMLMIYDDSDKPEKSTWEFNRKTRDLATADADTATISDPVICLENGDSLQFSIDDYDHYPEYDENNILNSNEEFDYGPFLELSDQIDSKALQGQTGATNPILFSYTFSDGGTYVFLDHTITTNQLVVVVAGSGETCENSNTNIQTSSSRSLGASGASQSDNIVLDLDTNLLAAIIVFMVLIICIIALSVAYCLHKAFDLSRPKVDGYRRFQKAHDLDFEVLGDELAPEVAGQDLVHNWPVENEDDMENVDFNIHADIIKHSKDFLDTYDDAMLVSEERKLNERRVINDLINEIDFMIKIVGESAIDSKMYYGPAKDMKRVEQDLNDDQDSTDKSSNNRSPNNGMSDGDEDDQALKQYNQEILRREEELRAQIIKDDPQAKEEKIKKEIMQEMGYHNPDDEEEVDNQGLSLHDQIKRRIENDDNFDQHDKDRMMFDYDKKLEGIESELEKERDRQHNSLSQQLKGRAELRRKKLDLKANDENKKEELDQEMLQ
jgi:hypothetical protein